MKESRKRAIEKAKGAMTWGIVLGTLRRQGNPKILERLQKRMSENGFDYVVVLMSEISPTRVALFEDSVYAWIQIACPRFSIDWGDAFRKPLLTPFEAEIALQVLPRWWEKNLVVHLGCSKGKSCCGCGDAEEVVDGDYPMDFYAQDGEEWNSSYVKKLPWAVQRTSAAIGAGS